MQCKYTPEMGFSYKKKLILIFLIIALGTIAGGVTTYLNQQTLNVNNKWVEHTVDVLYESEKALSLSEDIVLIGQGYAITGDSSLLSKFNSTLRVTNNSITILKNLVKDNNKQMKRIDSLHTLILDRINLSNETMLIRSKKGFATTPLLINATKGMDKIRNLISWIQAEEKKLLKIRQDASANSYSIFTSSLYTLICFTMLLLLIAFFVIKHNLLQESIFRESSILESKSKEMEQFTYITSHELRHPLLTIEGYIKILEEDYADKLDKEANYYLKSISSAAKQMEIRIIGLFNYSMLSQIKKLENVNCNKIAESLLVDLHTIIESTRAKITVNNLPTLKVSPPEFKQLFQHLITNALKFKKMDVIPELIISVKKKKDSYQFEFCDNGIGIERKNIKKIFNIFKRLHTPDEYEGAGLGLAYCKKIVELHHGTIWVKSQPGSGSSFYFTIKI
jgi:signal transduction histidine kinase